MQRVKSGRAKFMGGFSVFSGYFRDGTGLEHVPHPSGKALYNSTATQMGVNMRKILAQIGRPRLNPPYSPSGAASKDVARGPRRVIKGFPSKKYPRLFCGAEVWCQEELPLDENPRPDLI